MEEEKDIPNFFDGLLDLEKKEPPKTIEELAKYLKDK